jgi:hypothetical protein
MLVSRRDLTPAQRDAIVSRYEAMVRRKEAGSDKMDTAAAIARQYGVHMSYPGHSRTHVCTH